MINMYTYIYIYTHIYTYSILMILCAYDSDDFPVMLNYQTTAPSQSIAPNGSKWGYQGKMDDKLAGA